MEVSVGHRWFVIGSWFTASHWEAGLHWLGFRDDEDSMDFYFDNYFPFPPIRCVLLLKAFFLSVNIVKALNGLSEGVLKLSQGVSSYDWL